MLLCDEVKFKTIINVNYHKDNIFVQKLGNIWLKAIIRCERDRSFFR